MAEPAIYAKLRSAKSYGAQLAALTQGKQGGFARTGVASSLKLMRSKRVKGAGPSMAAWQDSAQARSALKGYSQARKGIKHRPAGSPSGGQFY